MKPMVDKDKISVVVPCYNEQEVIPLFYSELCLIAEKLRQDAVFELIFVDDGSSDNTLNVIKELPKGDIDIRYVSFSRNFGKEAAMYAGLEKSSGDYVVIMDVDLQDPPKLLPVMYDIVREKQYDCVATRRVTRKGEPPIRSFFARCFYRIINKISKTEIVDGARDYRFMNRNMVNAILSLKEYNRFSKGIFSWVGFRTKWLEYENVERAAGESKWSFWKLFIYSLDGIVGFSTVPLGLASVAGVIACLIAFIMICVIIMKTIVFGDPVSGWPSLACIIIFIGGIQLLCVGILGQYLSKVYLETKQRPIYIKKEER
jgi:glycosyltransferase involved in cell wall biosynthesis